MLWFKAEVAGTSSFSVSFASQAQPLARPRDSEGVFSGITVKSIKGRWLYPTGLFGFQESQCLLGMSLEGPRILLAGTVAFHFSLYMG